MVRMKRRNSPHRFGRQSRINEHPREIGEPSQRVIERVHPLTSSGRTGPLDSARSRDPIGYAELHCLSNFSFQRGASSALELFLRAKKLGLAALAITDECSLAGIVRAHEAANETGLRLLVGTEVRLEDGPKLVILAADQSGYSAICRLITTGCRRSAKGEYRLTRADAEQLGAGVHVLWTPGPLQHTEATARDDAAKWIMQHFARRAWLAVELHRGPDDATELAQLRALGAAHGLPLVAAGDVHMHVRRRRALQDVMTAIRLRRTVAEAGHALFPNGERHLRRIEDLAALYPRELLDATLRIAAQCTFRLDQLDYRYPRELTPAGLDAIAHLRALTWAGAARHWPHGVPSIVRAQVEKELELIEALKYEHFFLTVEDIVRWARAQSPPILCQGRGSSANSAVCYCLGITAVNPATGNLLFERFLSKERDEPPDIDVDFEHERREEVIQYVFAKYGRDRAALAATVISYRRKSATRDVGRALGLSDDALDQLSAISSRVPDALSQAQAIRARGFDPDSRVIRQLVALVGEIKGFPRHLSQHVGGFVISDQPLHHLVPVENAAMPERTIIQWDKDDLETMKLLKVDCLALGMLTCLRKCIDLLHAHGLWQHAYSGAKPSLKDIPQHDDADVYAMIQRADTVGVFQIESRAQMSMLPRLKPTEFYDLVIEVAIVRPGPIQGNMVHPYLRRRNKQEPIDYPQSKFERASGTQASQVKDALERTLGVPIFQEQVMKLIQVVAGFTPGEADQLRRAMAAWKRRGGLEKFHDRIRDGMLERGYDMDYFERIFEQIKGFGDYGFPESHAASFALLAWASSWLKYYHPAAFTCALLNSQPMGFYQASQLIQDAQRHGVRVLPADVTVSNWDCALEKEVSVPEYALRLGLRQIKGLALACAERIVAARTARAFDNVADLTERAQLNTGERACLANAGALRTLSGHRYRARWESAGAEIPLPVLAGAAPRETDVALRRPSVREDVFTDYATQGLSLTLHPLALIRPQLTRRRVVPARTLVHIKNHGRRLRGAGLVTVRQHPGTAKGVTFVTLEDETGQINVVVWQALAERQHRVLLESSVMAVDGKFEAHDGVYHLIADRLYDYSALLMDFSFASRDFH
jgi:error-prone DNA polymerase